MTHNYYKYYFYQIYKFIKSNFQYYTLEVSKENFFRNNTFFSLVSELRVVLI